MARARGLRRHLLARVGGREDEHVLLQFPPGLLIRDVLQDPHDPQELKHAGFEPSGQVPGCVTASERFLGLLRDAGAREVERGPLHRVCEALTTVLVPQGVARDLTLAAWARGCLDANSRLARGDAPTPVSLDDYAMDIVGDRCLLTGLPDAAMRERAVVIGRVAVRREDLGRFRWLTAVDALVAGDAVMLDRGRMMSGNWIPCRLHRRACSMNCLARLHSTMVDGLRPWWLWARVPLLPDDADRAENDRVAWARDIARRVLDALPDEAWSPLRDDFSPYFARALAYARAETCEEYALLAAALRSCRSPREAVRRARARDAAWEVGRALDGPAVP